MSFTIDVPTDVSEIPIPHQYDRIFTSAEAVNRSVMASKWHVGSIANNARVSSDLGSAAAGVTSDPITGDVILSNSSYGQQILRNISNDADVATVLSTEDLLRDESNSNPPWLVSLLSLAAKLPIAVSLL